jgi:hypothetical protein
MLSWGKGSLHGRITQFGQAELSAKALVVERHGFGTIAVEEQKGSGAEHGWHLGSEEVDGG